MNTNTEALREREEVEMLLPWYAGGKLDAEDVARVEAYLARHPEMRERLDLVRKEQTETLFLNRSSTARPVTSAEQFMSEVVGRPSTQANILSRLKGLFAAPAAMRWATAAAMLVILVQAAAIVMLATPRVGGEYRQASGETRPKTAGTFVLVRFAEGAEISDLAKLLADLDMTITEGPVAGGLFRVRIGPTGMTETDRQRQVGALSARKDLVVFVTATK